MLFNSYYFILLFLPITWCIYFGLNALKKYKLAQVSLVAASLFFYGYYNWYYLSIICVSIIVNYGIAKVIGRENYKHRKSILTLGLAFNIGLLLYFKYTNFFIDNINAIFHTDFFVRQILLPLGISFYTFQQIGFLVDVYREETENLQLEFLDYAEFVSFFPQLVAGPIVSKELIYQIKDLSNRKVNFDNMAGGLMLFAIGLFKKVILADTFARAVNWGFSNISGMNSVDAVIVMLSYTFQIYFDFSGYSDMALGLAGMFNFKLPLNFNAPYQSYDILEFWQRWHMTLTSFLQKYIYIPLGGNRKGKVRTYVNVLAVFLISGFWHGANWTFVVWGMLHGVASVLNRTFKKQWDKLHRAFRWICTFVFINLTWLVFRADTLSQAKEMIAKIFAGEMGRVSKVLAAKYSLMETEILNYILLQNYALSQTYMIYVFIIVSTMIVVCVRPFCMKKFSPNIRNFLGIMFIIVWSVLSLAGESDFIYFGF
ncbi:MAG: MBOAT family protein [Lachnospiraceae bacterium]|nr:MBOAT family protein [Lachnospiraceae bacterium]